jgi:hypothetical protein
MTEKSHTPGPWEILAYCEADTAIQVGHRIRLSSSGHGYQADWVCEVDGGGEGEITPRMEADAALIASAPSLLSACEYACCVMGCYKGTAQYALGEAYARLRAAIVKAKGW